MLSGTRLTCFDFFCQDFTLPLHGVWQPIPAHLFRRIMNILVHFHYSSIFMCSIFKFIWRACSHFGIKTIFSGMVFPIVLLVLLSILCSNLYVSWPFSIPRCHLTSIGIPIVAIKERQSHDCLIWLPIPVRCFLYIEPGTWTLSGILTCWMWLASLTFTLNSFHCGLVTSYGNIDLS